MKLSFVKGMSLLKTNKTYFLSSSHNFIFIPIIAILKFGGMLSLMLQNAGKPTLKVLSTAAELGVDNGSFVCLPGDSLHTYLDRETQPQ